MAPRLSSDIKEQLLRYHHMMQAEQCLCKLGDVRSCYTRYVFAYIEEIPMRMRPQARSYWRVMVGKKTN